ncbi:GSU3473 family protein [Desulfuromonas sp. AOP6]|uniref:GSU3473 family protein n=1 Tax=Desulfuromonas sp. AOP6 TaxID=1566351 RepID=UPI00127687DB|nr:hypothetical protein [Desulfuromonas sp. AOP6]BCA80902.1 hypothetical protein AOP6_2689 [Desulfuromonas sp. AOP6]
MMIRVIYHDGRQDVVNSRELDGLIASGKIHQFLRQSGWVMPGYDPIRRMTQTIKQEDPRRSP